MKSFYNVQKTKEMTEQEYKNTKLSRCVLNNNSSRLDCVNDATIREDEVSTEFRAPREIEQ